MSKLTIISTVDGRHRGGARFKLGAQSFAADHFSEEQLREIVNDHVLTVVVGEALTADQVPEFVAANGAPKKAPRGKGPAE